MAPQASIGGYSDHTSQDGLVDFVTRMQKWQSDVGVMRGEAELVRALVRKSQGTYAKKNLSDG
jgi:predicted metal-dependent RNase